MPKENLNVKIGSKAEVLWTTVAKEAKVLIEQSESNIIVQKAILQLAESKIEEEKKNFK